MAPTHEGSLVMSDGPAAALYQPRRIGTMQLRNRFVQAPIFTQFASTFGEVDDKLIEYHRARARGGVGLIITENTSIDWEVGRTAGHPMRIDHDRFIGGLSNLVDAVHGEGAKIAVQRPWIHHDLCQILADHFGYHPSFDAAAHVCTDTKSNVPDHHQLFTEVCVGGWCLRGTPRC